MKHAITLALMMVILSAGRAWAADPPAIRELQGLSPQTGVFDAASDVKPLVLTSDKDAAAYFAKEELAKLIKEVDFSKQIVLIFAWRGSGQDRLQYTVAESAPESVTFTLTRGRTKDLHEHVHIYILGANVKWTVKTQF